MSNDDFQDGTIEFFKARLAEAQDQMGRLGEELEGCRWFIGHRAAVKVWRERAEQAEARLAEVVGILHEIEEGAGPFSRDPLEHASNCIEAMKAKVRAALAAVKEKP